MDQNTVTILNEKFENDKTGAEVLGITIIVDGKLKEVLDLLIKIYPRYTNYTEIVRDAFFNGLNSMIMEHRTGDGSQRQGTVNAKITAPKTRDGSRLLKKS